MHYVAVVMLGSGSKPQLLVSHAIIGVNTILVFIFSVVFSKSHEMFHTLLKSRPCIKSKCFEHV